MPVSSNNDNLHTKLYMLHFKTDAIFTEINFNEIDVLKGMSVL